MAEHNTNKRQSEKMEVLQKGLETQANAVRMLHRQLIAATTSLSRAVRDSRHVETGTVSCGNSQSWRWNAKEKTKNKYNTVKFKEAYSIPPKVFVALNYVNVNTNRPIRYYAFVQGVNTTHASIACREYEQYGGSLIQWLQVDWLSMPNAL